MMNPGEYIIFMVSVPKSMMSIMSCSFALTLHSICPEEFNLSRVWWIEYSLHYMKKVQDM